MDIQVLGLEPYVLITLKNAKIEDDGDGMDLSVAVQWGGGLNRGAALELLLEVAEHTDLLPGEEEL
jgi:hypothetical protein